MIRILKRSLVGAAVCWAAWGAGVHAVAGEAADVVAELQDSLITIMKEGDALGYQGRYDAIAPVVDRTHDLNAIARLVVGRRWKGLAAAQRAAFLRTFRDLSIATYAARFKDYDGERFDVLSEKPLRKDSRAIVTGRFVKADGERLTFSYMVHRVNRRWTILNISVNGVSDVALKRAEYGGILRREGFPALLRRLQDRIQDNTRGL